jgi:hypothetical protein
MASQGLKYFFILSALLVIVFYFTGSTAVAQAFGGMIQTISYAVTGRDSKGAFASYPK